MTISDNLKSAFTAYLDENEARLQSIEAGLKFLTPVVSPPADDPPPADGPPANDPPADDPPPVEDPPPSDPVDPVDPPPVDPPAPNLVRVTTTDKAPIHPGTGNTIVLVQNGTVASNWVRKDDPALPGVPVYRNSHGNGQPIYLDGCIAMWVGTQIKAQQVWPETPVPLPDGTLTPPAAPPATGGSTTPPPATTPTTPAATGQVIPQISMPPAGVSVAPENLSVVITPADSTIPPVTLSGANATAFRDIKVAFAGITQKHSRAVSADGLWSVRFLPDADGKRIEFDWQWGNCNLPNPHTFGAYTIEFFAGTTSLGSFSVPKHYWMAEPRVATADRPDALTRDQVFANKWLPKYGVTPVSKSSGPGAAKEFSLMTISNITAYMGQTGGRPDIGYLTEYASHFYATGDAASRRAMRIWAEASGTGPWHLYDTAGRMFDFQKNPTASTYNGANNKPPIYQAAKDTTDPNVIQPDDPHEPNLCFPEFIITGDPKHARELMNLANYYLGAEHGDGSDFHAALMKVYGPKTFMVETGQQRGSAWMLRLFFDAWLASTLIDDETLLQTAFWKMVMDHNRDIFIQYFVNNTSEARTAIFKAFPTAAIYSSWQQDFMYGVVGIMEQSGFFPDWKQIYDWCIPALTARRDPASGDKRVPAWYYAYGALPTFKADAANTGTFSLDALKFNGWATTAKGSYLQFGDWNFLMVDDTNFTLTHAVSGRVLKGAFGTMFGGTDIGKNPGMNFTISGAPKAGDKGVVNIRDFTSQKEFFDTNNFDPHWTTWSDYIGDYFWASTLFAANHPEVAAYIPGLVAEMQQNGLKIDYKYSVAA